MAQRRLQVGGMRFGIDAMQRAQRCDDHFPRRHRGHQPNADLPVKSQRTNHRLDGVSHLGHHAVLHLPDGWP